MPDFKLAAGINFGKPATEFIVEATEAGEATSCRNVVTGVEYIGGGGSSDFSTAEVTFNISNDSTVFTPVVTETPMDMILSIPIGSQMNGTYNVVLYKNKLGLVATIEGDVVVTGDIVYNSDEKNFLVTGDGSITISGEGPK